MSWGLPYPFHPDERNMASTIQNLQCDSFDIRLLTSDFTECFNPHFFAYGQFPLYIGYLGIQLSHLLVGKFGQPINFEEATLSLRFISALASIINAFVLVKIVDMFVSRKSKVKSQKSYFGFNLPITNYQLIALLLIIFSPFFIQFSHFGTTESLLMLFYTLIVYWSLKLFQLSHSESSKRDRGIPHEYENRRRAARSFGFPKGLSISWGRAQDDTIKIILLLSLFSGLAVATKISAIVFMGLPILVLIKNYELTITNWEKTKRFIVTLVSFVILTSLFAIFFSPHNLISSKEFINSMNYESSVGTGALKVFYTRQFENTQPILFQLSHIFPYVLGWPIFLFSMAGIFLLPFKKNYNILRIALLIYFLPTVFLYTKWTRFMAPILPLMIVFATLFLIFLYEKFMHLSKLRVTNYELRSDLINKFNNYKLLIIHFSLFIIMLMCIIPGVAFLSIYQQEDVRFKASNWIYKNIPSNSVILSEGGNVIDIPIPDAKLRIRQPADEIRNYRINNFDFYNLEHDVLLQNQLSTYIDSADYIFVPSRRVFMNHMCESNSQIPNSKFQNNCQYPFLTNYYNNLFSGALGFQKVAEFTSYPKISIFGKTLLEFPDEEAEETWSVFDHPVIRIYKRAQF
ncbi:MAG TPA: hypothetical protein VK338_03075 [Candidatus Nitrosocosmicus sp.]|nr:hypothetical protein [Candidatus Nitrosocosmicus sp.]